MQFSFFNLGKVVYLVFGGGGVHSPPPSCKAYKVLAGRVADLSPLIFVSNNAVRQILIKTREFLIKYFIYYTFFGYGDFNHLVGPLRLREDTHKKVFFFSDRTTKGVGRVNPPDH